MKGKTPALLSLQFNEIMFSSKVVFPLVALSKSDPCQAIFVNHIWKFVLIMFVLRNVQKGC